MMPYRLLAVLGLSVVCGVTAAAAQTPSGGVECGDTITADTALDRDLVDCPSNGIVIGADGITLDLNGHTIAGDGEPVRRCPRRQYCDVGVANDGYDGVTVQNGSVRGFASGVIVGRARGNRVLRMSSSRNQFFGFVIAKSARSVIRDSSGNDNPAPDGDGLGVFFSHDLRIVGNAFRRNGQIGMHIEDSTRNLIKGNVFARNHDFGILLEADHNQVRGNRTIRNGTGIQVGPASRNVVAGNRISGGGDGIAVEKGRGNVVARNVVVGVRKSGIRLGIDEPSIGSTRTLVRRNLVIASGRDGFLVEPADRFALLRRNTARGSGDDGFDIESRSARLRGNRAVGSADLGIEWP